MDVRSISVLGCGWLGFPLAQYLVQLGFTVKGSSTERDKFPLLKESKITPFFIKADPQITGEDIDSFFQSKILFLNIPFRRGLKDPTYYKRQIDAVVASVKLSPIEFVIFASSTSVYPESSGEALEGVSFEPDNARSEVLRDIEESLFDCQEFQTTVIRFSGLYGGERQIGRVMAGRKGIPEGEAPVNLIHLDDCIAIVAGILDKNVRGDIYNACSDRHPTREDIYTKSAQHYGLEPPQFEGGPQHRFKIVSNKKIKEKLDYTFKHSDPSVFNYDNTEKRTH